MVFVICVNIFLTNHRGTEDAEEEGMFSGNEEAPILQRESFFIYKHKNPHYRSD